METYSPEDSLGPEYLKSGAREYIAAYPSVRKLALSIVGRRRRGSPQTVGTYLQGIRSLCVFLGLEPEEVIQQAKAGQLDLVKRINDEGDGWIDTSLNGGKANKTIVAWTAGIKRWLEVNDVQLDWAKVVKPNSMIIKNRDRALTPAELNLMLSFCDLKETAALSLLATSGLRVGTLLSLRWGELDFNFKPDVVKITVGREMGRKFGAYRDTGGELETFTTFGSTKTREAVLAYKKSLEVSGHSARKDKITPTGPENYVFSAPMNSNRKMGYTAFQWRWSRLIQRSGLTKRLADRFEIKIHSLRKYFRTRASGLDLSIRESMLGHRGQYLDASYLRLTEQDLYEAYVAVMPRLEVEVGMAEQEVSELKRQIAGLKAQVEAEKRHNEYNDERFSKLDKKVEKLLAGQG